MNSNAMYSELERMNELVFKPGGFVLTSVQPQVESREYFAHTFQLDGQQIQFRTAKITPTKTGQFVAIWKRNQLGITAPFDIADEFDFYIIATRQNENFGLFIFPKTALHEHKILSDKTRDGKRGIRVYPTWNRVTNKQAQKTQLWQTNYFLEIKQGQKVDLTRAKRLLNHQT